MARGDSGAGGCGHVTPWGPCQQTVPEGVCSFHADPRQSTDRYYHRKVALGLVTLTDTLSKAEVRALLHGRRKNDGRAIDEWVV